MTTFLSDAEDMTADRTTDYRRHPERYRAGLSENGVLKAEPYASELLPYLHFRGERGAKHSAQTMYLAFMRYRDESDFVGMDMAKKFLEMGWLRCRRYDSLVDAGRMFYSLFQKARNDPTYVVLKGKHRQLYER